MFVLSLQYNSILSSRTNYYNCSILLLMTKQLNYAQVSLKIESPKRDPEQIELTPIASLDLVGICRN